jgi:hypothetical protein
MQKTSMTASPRLGRIVAPVRGVRLRGQELPLIFKEGILGINMESPLEAAVAPLPAPP